MDRHGLDIPSGEEILLEGSGSGQLRTALTCYVVYFYAYYILYILHTY